MPLRDDSLELSITVVAVGNMECVQISGIKARALPRLEEFKRSRCCSYFGLAKRIAVGYRLPNRSCTIVAM